ncbi:unnamed protein product [Clonostachys chloroleuca]|uniref:Uncharacterized protein n=1 Tax=Clonostachys chloroleuca TaxID=1926264 RepID=A0AA35VI77_9HYPO|nr:unnamed protein product [Clonostachys chloroleuca]
MDVHYDSRSGTQLRNWFPPRTPPKKLTHCVHSPGKSRSISVFDVVVGDILQVEAGDVLPADSILIRGSEILCDESTLAGESKLVQKASATMAGDHLMLSGTKVVSGIGSYLVVAVGIHSTYGKVVQSLDDYVQETPLQQKPGRLAKYIINFGLVTGAMFFIIHFSCFLADLGSIEGGSQAKGQAFLERSILASSDLRTELAVETSDLLKAAIAINSTAMETSTPGEFIGSSTETSLLKFVKSSLGMDAVSVERNKVEIVHMVPFDSRHKWMAAVIKTGPSRFRLLIKGAAEVLLCHCTTTLSEPVQGLSAASLEPDDVAEIDHVISKYGDSLLREEPGPLGEAALAALVSDLTFLGAFGIEDPLRPNVADSAAQCQAVGVFVRMVTGDSFATAKSIASTCDIYTPGGIALNGPTFRRLTGAQLDLIAQRIQAIARSSPEDKRRLVLHLKDLGEVVAVIGDGTNDALALKSADIGFSMGISGTEVAKEASDIILMDDNFASIVKAMSWGRAINDATKTFLQFQFAINITAGLLTIVTALVGGPEDSIFRIVQLLRINLIMETFAALAMSTDYPAESALQRRPEPHNKLIINTTMWKTIGGQSLYQAAVILFEAESDDNQLAVDTLAFNTYVLMQFFNQSNCRRADNHLNIFEDSHRNPWFWFVQAVTLGGQMTIIFVGGEAFRTSRLDGRMWGWSILFAIITWPLGVILRFIPDESVRGA